MYQSIQTKLHQIATSEPLHLLLAVESGSRTWGFPSPDSDYDVRAIYIRQPESYLCIDEPKDTFEYIENQWFDVGGWDIRKALRLLRKSNAVLLEWLRSPIVYAQDDEFVHALAELAPQYAQTAPLLHHYRGIARNALSNMDLHGEIRLKNTLGSATRRHSAHDVNRTGRWRAKRNHARNNRPYCPQNRARRKLPPHPFRQPETLYAGFSR